MSLNVCGHCTTRFSIGAPHCPQCGNADYYEEASMAKISRHGGPTTVEMITADGPVDITEYLVGGQVAAHELFDALTAEPEADLEAALDEVFEVEGPYGVMLRADLQAECLARGLPSSGTKAELVARLVAADEADQADEEQDSDAA